MSRTSEYRRFQDRLHKKRLEEMLRSVPSVVYWNDYTNRKYLKIYYYGNPFHKKQGRRRARRITYDEKIPKGNLHHKYYDYWWNIT